VTGEGIARPKNLFTAIGTPISDLVEQCGGFTAKKVFVIHGGPLMGTALTSTDVPVVKGTTGIVVLPAGSLKDDPVLGPCLRCGRCAAICPMGLNPATLGTRAEQGRINELKESGIEYCFECGLCAFTCPSQRPVTQLIREAKVRLRSLEQTQQKK
jgi:electron transport complex protein RnfC